MAKDGELKIRCESGLVEAIDRLAARERRTRSNLVLKILTDYVEHQEALEKAGLSAISGTRAITSAATQLDENPPASKAKRKTRTAHN